MALARQGEQHQLAQEWHWPGKVHSNGQARCAATARQGVQQLQSLQQWPGQVCSNCQARCTAVATSTAMARPGVQQWQWQGKVHRRRSL